MESYRPAILCLGAMGGEGLSLQWLSSQWCWAEREGDCTDDSYNGSISGALIQGDQREDVRFLFQVIFGDDTAPTHTSGI